MREIPLKLLGGQSNWQKPEVLITSSWACQWGSKMYTTGRCVTWSSLLGKHFGGIDWLSECMCPVTQQFYFQVNFLHKYRLMCPQGMSERFHGSIVRISETVCWPKCPPMGNTAEVALPPPPPIPLLPPLPSPLHHHTNSPLFPSLTEDTFPSHLHRDHMTNLDQ